MTIRRSLIVTGEGIGNVIQSTAAMALFREIFQGSMELDVLMPGHRAFAPLIQGPVQVYTKPDRTRDYAYLIPSWLLHKYSVKLADGLPERPKVVPGTDPLRLDISESESHMQAVLEVAKMEGRDSGETPGPRTFCNHASAERLKKYTDQAGPIICLHDGGNPARFWRAKRYPDWQGVYSIVSREVPSAFFLILGTGKDGSITGERTVDLRGQCSLLETAGLLKEARLYIGNDTGLGHIAAALGTPAHVVFGPTNITKNLPPQDAFPIHETDDLACRPCQRLGAQWRIGVDGKRCNIECLHQLPAEIIAERIVGALREERV
jgi:ADP-heptose:LPS heptosyltransferase